MSDPVATNPAGTPLVELRNVTKVFGGGGAFSNDRVVTALDNFNYTIQPEPATITAVVGESGSGKSTMANMLLGLEKPSSGEVLYKGKDIWKFSRDERRTFRREVQAIFQDPYGVYNSFYKVDHVLTTPVAKFKMASSNEETDRMISEALLAVGLRPEDTLGRYPHQLSGGQRQRTMIARTLLLRPRIIIADEPVSMVDASLRVTILASLLKLKSQFGISLIYITHDLATAYQISDHIIVLNRGVVVEQGTPDAVVKNPQHPYTQLLISSIPQADPDKAWGESPADSFDGTGDLRTVDFSATLAQNGH
ncbi:MAG: ABC transporter ATP-binding protein [Thermomicrobiales bacterium]|nr:ABC transporter ATP-binding protein [Thermomicrobiales bacterium]